MSTKTEPLLSRAWVISVIGAVVAVAALFGLPAALGDQIVAGAQTYAGGASSLLLFAAPHVLAWLGRKHVTPVAAPKDNDGSVLVPAATVAPVYVAAPADLAVSVSADGVTAESVLAAAEAIHPATAV